MDPAAPHSHHHHHHDVHLGPEYDGPIEEHPLWQRENVTLNSVGIDIGSSGTQILFSRMHLRRQAVDLSSRYLVVERDTYYQSPVALTPYLDETRIDARALGAIVDDAYQAARVHPDDIDTGAVILTGEALRRENAERIARILSEKCGELVCATAGHHMEAMLAAYGSGAAKASHDRAERILNIDMGGGTTKLSVIEKGRILATAAIHIGARLVAVDDGGRIERLEPAGRAHAERAGFSWSVGDEVGREQLEAVAESMADDLVAALTAALPPRSVMDLYLSDPISHLEGITSIIFSGGVAEYYYGRESRDFGDLGQYLGKALRHRVEIESLPWTVLQDSHGIRSTALGASEYTVQLSGNTTYISDASVLLPRRNLQVLHPEFEFTDDFAADDLGDAIRQHVRAFEVDNADIDFALAFHWDGGPEFRRIEALAEGIRRGLQDHIARGKPLYVVLDADIAMTLGAVLFEDLEIRTDLLVIDGVSLWDFDFIDLGRLRSPSNTVSVTIKSLLFHEIQKGPRRLGGAAPEVAGRPAET